MHRRHYEMIARTLKTVAARKGGTHYELYQEAIRDVTADLAKMLAEENANFDADKFAKACGA